MAPKTHTYLHALQNQSLIVQQIAIFWCLHQADYQLKYIFKKNQTQTKTTFLLWITLLAFNKIICETS